MVTGRLAGVLVLVVTGCGRIGFERPGAIVAGDGANGDGVVGDGVVGDGLLALSCASLAATCGQTGAEPCCGSPLVSGGSFRRSYDVASDGMFPDMTNPATVSDFRLDTYEVTVGRFRQFVSAGKGTRADPPAAGAGARTLNGMPNQAGWDPAWNAGLTTNTAALVAGVNCDPTYQAWTDVPGTNESVAMNCITWSEAMAFCVWDGGFLPTEAEWNYAAAGGNEQRAYPWSSPASALGIDCSYANYQSATGECVAPPTGAPNRVGSESPRGDGRWGQADLGGNVWEWTLDWYTGPPAYPNPCNNCADLTSAFARVIRGGSFSDMPSSVRVGIRNFAGPGTRYYVAGVRCARLP